MTAINVFLPKSQVDMGLRNQYLDWINRTLKTSFTAVGDMCTGAAYCQLMDLLFPKSVPLERVKMFTNDEREFLFNYRLLQIAFHKVGVQRAIPVSRLVKAHPQDNMEFLQWFKKFFDTNYKGHLYDPIMARHGESMGIGQSAAQTVYAVDSEDDVLDDGPVLQAPSLPKDMDLGKRVELLELELSKIRLELYEAEQLRDDYLKRLLDIEGVCRLSIRSAAIKEIRRILMPIEAIHSNHTSQ